MSSKHESVFDRRIVARNIKHGRATRKEYEQHLANLEDVTAKAVPISVDRERLARDQSGSDR